MALRVFIFIFQHHDTFPREGPTECAQLEELENEVLLAVGAQRVIDIAVTNLPETDKVPVR